MSVSVGLVYPITEDMRNACGSIQTCGSNATSVRITEIDKNGSLSYDILNSEKIRIAGCCFCVKSKHLDTPLTTNIKDMAMDIIQQFRLSMKGEPEKTFIKAGIIDNDEKFTSAGKELFNAFLLHKFGAEFKKEVVDPLLDEMKESK